MMRKLQKLLKSESVGGILLLLMAVLALLVRNSSLWAFYDWIFRDMQIVFEFGPIEYHESFLLFINDGLMAIFFLLVGMEVKREIVEGELSKVSQMILPGIAALGGMLIPAFIFASLNWGNHENMPGWAVPTATDIAFALGVLSLFGRRVPVSLKMFLMTLAVLDDLGAVMIIAVFYSHGVNFFAMGMSAVLIGILFLMNRRGVVTLKPYWVLGIFLWFAMLASGVHATLAGVILAFMVPLKRIGPQGVPPLVRLGRELHVPVTFAILPLFAFANAGVSFYGTRWSILAEPLTLGIFAGLFCGKQLGVFLFSYVSIKLKLVTIPKNVSWMEFYGVSILCGIGFTMSLFISTLAFHSHNPTVLAAPRVGILLGSILSAVVGYFVLRLALIRKERRNRA